VNLLEELGAVRDLYGEGPEHRCPCGFIEFEQLHILSSSSVPKDPLTGSAGILNPISTLHTTDDVPVPLH